MLYTLSLVLDHVKEVMMVLRRVLATSIAEMLLEVIPHVRLLLSARGCCTRIVIVTRHTRTLVGHDIFT